ncbi:trehalose 6-phosphate phosphatase [Ancylobacter sp. 3268]|uniref:trehalose-phosphatase n=1 Tax=Ancylobacter sp. 3268 TaxID=2817752 RepID=UPI0028643CD9|nr:trehalose-phosphatase [Ancylobacter sp. 3268]MDR6954689.1 trehalose 6-phosphate phosphatase [Ancylobacter sp. 3268]
MSRVRTAPRYGTHPTPRSDWALFLDIDGTLIEHADHPEGVTIPEDLPTLLMQLQTSFAGAVALVSGRTVEWMDRRFAPARLAAAGQHGAELRLDPNGKAVPLAIPSWRQRLEEELDAALQAWPGVYLEHKPLSLAVHYRAVPQFEAEVKATIAIIANRLGSDIELLAGRFVVEIRQIGLTKGTAVKRFLETSPFAGRMPVFVGDDVTDEDGFGAAKAAGGLAVAVGPRPTDQADFRFDDPGEVRFWLASVVADSMKTEAAR